MTVNRKIAFYQKHMKAMAIRYNEKIGPFTENPDSAKINRHKWAEISKKQLKLMLDTIEETLVLMPDSFGVIKSASQVNRQNGLIGTTVIDTHTIYIINKNKIKYLKDHHISDRNLHLIEK